MDTSSYYHTFLARAYDIQPGLVTDESLFQALLLAFIAKRKHLIVRAADDEIPRVVKLAVNVSFITPLAALSFPRR